MKNPPHPGRIAKSAFEALGLSTAAAAAALGVTRAQVHRVVKGDSAISPEMALRLETVIGSSAETWLRLQAAFDAARIQERRAEIVGNLKRIEAPAETPKRAA